MSNDKRKEEKLLTSKKLQEVIRLTALGFSSIEIAKVLYLTPRGVEYHIKNAKDYFGANNKTHLIYLAIKRGWIN
ncbi:helix-turn-helix transcriptional regulator [Shewanella sp. 125m-7]